MSLYKSRTIPRGPRIEVRVTKDLIKAAVRGDSGYCMLAEAIKLAYPPAADPHAGVSVDLQTIRFSDREKRLRYIYLTPRVAQEALVDFDAGDQVEPFSIRLAGAHVIRMRGEDQIARDTERKRRTAAKKRALLTPERTGSRKGYGGGSFERVGGLAPPLQKTREGVPFSRRRAFGLKSLKR